jgi:hypothetical protein
MDLEKRLFYDELNCLSDEAVSQTELDFDIEKQVDDLLYTSFERQFDRLYQFCSDGMFDPDLGIFYLNKMSQTFHQFWYDCFVHSLDIMEFALYD